MEEVLAMKRNNPEEFHSLVKMHLSFILNLTTDEAAEESDASGGHGNFFSGNKAGKCIGGSGTPNKGIMEGAVLTMEGVCQIFQIIQYLEQPGNITTEGIFRKTGNLRKQQVLKDRLNRGVPMNLDDGEFSVHECASVVKMFLGELPEPLLTNVFFEAHCQAAEMSESKKLQAIQLLIMLIPDANWHLLKDLLLFLLKVSKNENRNKMSALNLGMIFASHVLCPRNLPSQELQSKHHEFSQAVAFMISNAETLFNPPAQLMKEMAARKCATPNPREHHSDSPVVNTIYSFVDHRKTRELAAASTTETALAELYAQVQSMPDSTKKKRLIKQFNEANGCGTPNATPVKQPGSAGARRAIGDSFKNWIVPKAKVVSEKKKSGSYNLKPRSSDDTGHHTFRKSLSDQLAPNVLMTPNSFKSETALGTPKTPSESQNSIYFKRNSGTKYSMMDECGSLVETKQLPDRKDLLPEFEPTVGKENFV